MLLIILLIVGLVALAIILPKIKRVRFGNLTLITGGVKTGKTQWSVALAEKQYRQQLRKWRRDCRRARKRYEPYPEKPLLYSNMPIGKKGDKYVPITPELITGEFRFAYGSVVYFNEASLISGSKDITDEELNDFLLQFYKLCAHLLKGGYVLLDTQSPQDLHYTAKRSLSTYFTIYRRLTLPFFSVLFVRENIFVDGDSTVAVDSMIDTQDSPLTGGKSLYIVPISNNWWKYYDRYAYSVLVENKPVYDKAVTIDSQKIPFLVRCRDILKTLKKRSTKYEKK